MSYLVGCMVIMDRKYYSLVTPEHTFPISLEFGEYLHNAIEARRPVVQAEINKYMRETFGKEISSEEETGSEEEMIFPSGGEGRKKFLNVSDEVWDELLACYDMNNLDIPEKKKLADDLMDKGIISETDRDRFINMLNQEKEKDISPSYSSETSYPNGRYSNSGGVLKGEIHVATLGSMMSEAEKDNIFARLDFNHLIEQIKDYAYCNG